jgi:hypothetical protein
MKTGPDALSTAENMSGSEKMKTGSLSAQNVIPPKASLSAQNVKTGHDALITGENESGHAKHEKGTLRPLYRPKRVQARKT